VTHVLYRNITVTVHRIVTTTDGVKWDLQTGYLNRNTSDMRNTHKTLPKSHVRRQAKPILQKYGVRALNGLNGLGIGSDSVPV
jgi:hypothetical protein